jgi:biopolymer transport protein ExbD
MAEILTGNTENRKGRRKPVMMRLDMTPLVDLAFLLLTFFILSTTLSVKRMLPVNYPKEQGAPLPIDNSRAMTFLLGEEEQSLFYYTGVFNADSNSVIAVDVLKGEFEKLIREKNAAVIAEMSELKKDFLSGQITEENYLKQARAIKNENPDAPYFLIKTADKTKYQHLVSLLDKLNKNEASQYAVQDMSPQEKQVLQLQLASLSAQKLR